jgi:hypothetical protein
LAFRHDPRIVPLCGGRRRPNPRDRGLGPAVKPVAEPARTLESRDPGRTAGGAIDRNGVLILIRSTLLALHHANQTGNYTVLRDLGAPGFQTNTAARLAEIFASQRAQNLDLSGVAVLEPQLTRLPQIVQGGLMHMAGFFPSVPLQVNFELLFAPVEGRWKLFGVSLNVGQTAPTAPQAPPDPKPEAAKPEEKPAEAKKPAARPKSPPRPRPPRPQPAAPIEAQP